MPMVRFICDNEECNNFVDKVYKKAKKIPSSVKCKKCEKGQMERQLGAPSSKGIQVIDNGVQSKKTVVMNDVVEQEREKLYNGDQ